MKHYAVIIPACDEEACLRDVLDELRDTLDPARFCIAVGVNGSTDRTAQIARATGAVVAETPRRGYGYGCQAAIDLLTSTATPVDAYLFLAADGANDPRDITALVAAHETGASMILGCRTTLRANLKTMGWRHMLANHLLGAWCGCLTGRVFYDLGPMRLIERPLFEAMQLREWTYGWTIEAQIRAVMLGASIREIPVRERKRLAGTQKVSGVSWRHTLRVALTIASAGWRARLARLPGTDHRGAVCKS